jgi:hypothetical protein
VLNDLVATERSTSMVDDDYQGENNTDESTSGPTRFWAISHTCAASKDPAAELTAGIAELYKPSLFDCLTERRTTRFGIV